jgi:predicted dithiol-disulfide oxidoreductase (DUF899 family)
MQQHRVVSQDEWLLARRQLLTKEKELTRLRDQLSAERRALPWVRVTKPYVFETTEGPRPLDELFSGRSQLVVKHFMMGPDWDEGCVGSSFFSDNIEGALVHLEHHDVSYVAVSRAPLEKITAFKRRMGWRFEWVSSLGNDFNYDFHVSFTPEEMARGDVFYNYTQQRMDSEEMTGLSVSYRDTHGDVFHTYSQYARGGVMFPPAYHFLDITPGGRNETINGNLTDWVRHHDRYGEDAGECCHGKG